MSKAIATRTKAKPTIPAPLLVPPTEEPLPRINHPDVERRERPGKYLASVSGGKTDRFNNVLLNRVMSALWLQPYNSEDRDWVIGAAFDALAGFAPKDEVEGMMAGQAVALHHAAMECMRRAMLPEQPFEMASRLRKEAANLSRAMVDMAEAIDKRRGKGQQTVRVEHVTVHAGGQAIVGVVTAPSRVTGGEE